MAGNQNNNHKLVRAKNRTKTKHMPVLVLHYIAHNIGDQAYPIKASTEWRQRLGLVRGEVSFCVTSIQDKTWNRLG